MNCVIYFTIMKIKSQALARGLVLKILPFYFRSPSRKSHREGSSCRRSGSARPASDQALADPAYRKARSAGTAAASADRTDTADLGTAAALADRMDLRKGCRKGCRFGKADF